MIRVRGAAGNNGYPSYVHDDSRDPPFALRDHIAVFASGDHEQDA